MVSRVYELMPGDVALGLAGDHLKTLLGSCVAVILTDPRHTVAAMCHIVHVSRPNAANRHNTAFGEVAMREMYLRLNRVGVIPRLCHAHVYGGGNMFPALVRSRHVGASNADWVLDFLSHEGIRVVDESVGGAGYRRVSWTVGEGDPVMEMVMVHEGEGEINAD